MQATYVVGQVWTSIKCSILYAVLQIVLPSAACTVGTLLLHMVMCGQ